MWVTNNFSQSGPNTKMYLTSTSIKCHFYIKFSVWIDKLDV